MNKKVRLTSLTAAALASVVLAGANVNSNVVKADTKPENTSAKAQTPEDAAKANVASAQKNVDTEQGNVNKAQGELDQAKKDAEKPDADYKAQSDKVAGLKKTADQKNSELTTAKDKTKNAKALAEEATDPEKVKAAGDAVAKQEGVVKNANEEKAAADKAVTDKKAEIKGLETQVKTATDNANAKTAAKKTADQKVQNAEDALKGTGIAEAKNAADDAKGKMNQTASDLNKAKTDRDNLNKNNSELAQKINNDSKVAKNLLDQANGAINQKEQTIKNNKEKINKLDNALSNLKELNDELNKNSLQFINVDKYKKAYADYFTNGLTQDDIDFIKSERANSVNEFKHSAQDMKENIADVNNLTDSQVEELSLFMSHLINGLRYQLDWDNVSVTKGSLKFAREVAQRYIADQKSKKWDDGLKITQEDDGYNHTTQIEANNWHDVAGINNVAKENGLEYDEDDLVYNDTTQSNDNQYYEDKGGEFFTLPVTMDQLKEHLFNTIAGMVFPDGEGVTSAGGSPEYEFGHAAGVLGASEDVSDGLQEVGYLSQSDRDDLANDRQWLEEDQKALKKAYESNDEDNINYYKEEIANLNGEIAQDENAHVLYVSAIPTSYRSISGIPGMDDSLFGDFHFLTVPLNNINDKSKFDTTEIPTYAERITKLNGKIEKVKSDLAEAKQKLESLSKKANVISEIKQAIDRVNGLNQQLIDDTSAYNSANDKYITLTSSHDQKVQKYNDAIASQTTAQKQLDEANGTLAQLKGTLNKANQKLSELQTTAGQKGKDAKEAQDQLDQLKQHVEDLKNAATILFNAQQAEADAQTTYDTAKKNLDEAQTVLNGDLKTNKDQADTKVKDAQTAYDNAVAKLNDAKSKLADAQQALQNILDAQQNPYIPEGPAQDLAPQQTADDLTQPISTSEPTQSTPTQTQDISAESTETTKTVETKKSQAPSYKIVTLTHNAIVYNKHGKAVRRGLHVEIIKRGKSVKALKHGKIVTIKGKRYYQIGNNEFIKVANTKKHVIHIKARIKGSKKIRTYNKHGKFNKHYARAHHTYTFNKKAKINGKTYYKIAGTNSWIPAKKLALKK